VVRSTETITAALNDDVHVKLTVPGRTELVRGALTVRLKNLDPGTQAALRCIADGPATFTELRKIAQAADAGAEAERLTLELNRLAGRQMAHFSCIVDGEELLRARATGPLARFSFASLPESGRVRLSRFAYVRRTGDSLTIVSPASHMTVEVLSPAIGELLVRLAQPYAMTEEVGGAAALGVVASEAVVAFLLRAGVLAVADEAGKTEEETSPALAQREFHDVAMHAATRKGLAGGPTGGTFRFVGQLPPTPAVRPLHDGPRMQLSRPDLEYITAHDPPLAQVMESRKSIRKYGTEPITVDQLAEFLFRVARIKELHLVDESAGHIYETTTRTSPSGGAAHDIELYPVVRQCAGLAPAIYHYDPSEHQLTLVCENENPVRRLLIEAYLANGRRVVPQVLIVMAARFARLSWKYEGIAYGITLKNTGVLYEAMYLAATAMGLAPCGIGGGESAVFSEAIGVNPMIESSVGEFMLGTREEERRPDE
jgi:oxazoline/thiazoline dehydrogenase